MSDEDKATAEGVRQAFDFWIAQHPTSMAEIVGDAVKAAFSSCADQIAINAEEADAALRAAFARGAEAMKLAALDPSLWWGSMQIAQDQVRALPLPEYRDHA